MLEFLYEYTGQYRTILYSTKPDNAGLNRVIQDIIGIYKTKPDYAGLYKIKQVYLGVNRTGVDYR